MTDIRGGGEPFINQLRRESLYGAFRGLNDVVFYLGLVVGILVILGSVLMIGSGSIGVGLGGILLGVLVMAVMKAAKEAALMVADLSDAAVRLAARAESSGRAGSDGT